MKALISIIFYFIALVSNASAWTFFAKVASNEFGAVFGYIAFVSWLIVVAYCFKIYKSYSIVKC